MPREQINFPRMMTSENPPGYTAIEPTVHVGWNRAGWVQVSISADAEHFRRLTADVEGASEAAIFSDTLDRQEVNKLIRTLRKARDQAYGSDA